MYRNNKISIGGNSEGSSSNEATDNGDQASITENKKDSLNDSISDMFKKMTIKDRRSKILQDVINVNDSNNNGEKNRNFMTSSPIGKKSTLEKPIFKTNLRPSNELDEYIDKENKIPFESIDDIKKSSQTNLQENNDEGQIVRAATVRYPKKPLTTDDKLKDQSKNIANKSLNRSNSCYRSNAALNSVSKITVPQPFSFEERDKELLANRNKIVEDDLLKIKRIASSFRANPMPISSPKLPEKVVAKTTNPVPFKFESEQRINYYQEKNSLKSLESSSMASLNNISASKKYDLSYLNKSPFKPKPTAKYVTLPETPNFSMEKRSLQRNDFNEQLRQKELLFAKEKEDREKERIENEKKEYQQFRNQTNIKAGPIRHYKKVDIVHEKKITMPTSPKFSDRFKK